MAFLAQGILGITGLVATFQSTPFYLNICEIILGALGFLVGVYAPQASSKKPVSSQQANDIDRQRKDIEQQRKDIDQQRKDIDQQRKELDQQKYEFVQPINDETLLMK